MTKVKVAECAVLFWDEGNLVWDDYLNHRQLALTEHSERVCRWFSEWREYETIEQLGDPFPAVARQLLDAGVLIEQQSLAHLEQNHVTAEWGAWGQSSRYHYFASRTDASVQYASVIEDQLRSGVRAEFDPPPSAYKTYPGSPVTAVSATRPDSTGWQHPQLVDALYARRSVRQFSPAPIRRDDVATIVQVAAGPVDIIEHPDLGSVLFKTSPSAGARSPVELYVYANRVEGLDRGMYHFAPLRGGLELVHDAVSAELIDQAVGGQPWLSEAPVLIFYTAVLARTRWRYENARAYRDIAIEVGHISQTVLLTATAMGLGSVTATALVDEAVERMLGTDSVAEPAFAVTALSVPLR